MGTLSEDMQRLGDEIMRLREDRRHQLQRLRGDVAGLGHEVREKLTEFRAQRHENADTLRGARQERIQELVSEIRTLRQGVREQLAQGESARRERAAQDHTERQQQLKVLKEDVETLRGEASSVLAEVREDMMQARRLWDALATTQAASARVQAAPVAKTTVELARGEETERVGDDSEAQVPTQPEPEASEVKAATPQKNEVPTSDDLEQIVGIGPSTSKVLQDAGIMSFYQIAQATPKELNEVLGDLSRFANVEHWIRQAKGLAG